MKRIGKLTAAAAVAAVAIAGTQAVAPEDAPMAAPQANAQAMIPVGPVMLDPQQAAALVGGGIAVAIAVATTLSAGDSGSIGSLEGAQTNSLDPSSLESITPGNPGESENDQPSTGQSMVQQVLVEINKARAEHQLRAYTADTFLDSDAQAWAESLVAQGSFYHNPNRLGASEIIAEAPDAARIVQAWLKSTSGHREAVLNSDSTRIGLGAAQRPNGQWVVVGLPNRDPNSISGTAADDEMTSQMHRLFHVANQLNGWGLKEIYAKSATTEYLNQLTAGRPDAKPSWGNQGYYHWKVDKGSDPRKLWHTIKSWKTPHNNSGVRLSSIHVGAKRDAQGNWWVAVTNHA